jgi:hypothetical protein
MNDRASLLHDTGDDRHHTVDILPPVDKILEEHRHIVVGIRARIAPRKGGEEHHALEPVAVDFIEGGAEAFQDRIIGRCAARGSWRVSWLRRQDPAGSAQTRRRRRAWHGQMQRRIVVIAPADTIATGRSGRVQHCQQDVKQSQRLTHR